MRRGQRVQFRGQWGTVRDIQPNGMIDVQLDGADFIQRCEAESLATARRNPSFRVGENVYLAVLGHSGEVLAIGPSAADPSSGYPKLREGQLYVQAGGTKSVGPSSQAQKIVVGQKGTPSFVSLKESPVISTGPTAYSSSLGAADRKEVKRLLAIPVRLEKEEKKKEEPWSLQQKVDHPDPAIAKKVTRKKALQWSFGEGWERALLELLQARHRQAMLEERRRNEKPAPPLPTGAPYTRRQQEAETYRVTRHQKGKTGQRRTELKFGRIQDKLRDGAAFFTQPDPPRLSQDKTEFCGNPIDGTAYFLAISDKGSKISRWVTKEAVKASGLSGPEYLKQLRQEVGEGNLQAVPDDSFRRFIRQRKDWSTGMKRSVGTRQRVVSSMPMMTDGSSDAYSEDRGGIGRTYYRTWVRRTPAKDRLDTYFLPYGDKSALSDGGPLLSEIGRKFNMTKAVAAKLVKSGAVSVNRRIVLDPTIQVKPEVSIDLRFPAKSRSPFFSWVKSYVPAAALQQEHERTFPCWGEDGKIAEVQLRDASSVLFSLNSQFKKIQSLTRKIATTPEQSIEFKRRPANFAMAQVESMSKSLAKLQNWWLRYAESAKSGANAEVKKLLQGGGVLPKTVDDPTVLLRLLAISKKLKLVKKKEDRWRPAVTREPKSIRSFYKMVLLKTKDEAPWSAMLAAIDGFTQGADSNPFADVMRKLEEVGFNTRPLQRRYAEIGGDLIPALLGFYGADEVDTAHDYRMEVVMASASLGEEDADKVAVADVALGFFLSQPRDPGDQSARFGPKALAAEKTAVNYLLLADLYYKLDGYYLTGPLSPVDQKEKQVLAQVANAVDQARRKLFGGGALGERDSYTVYKTYNPLLFEATKLYWRIKPGSLSWPGFAKQPPIWKKLDNAGIYGSSLAFVQSITMQSRSTEDFTSRLRDATREILDMIKQASKSTNPSSKLRTVLRDRQGSYTLLSLLWPLGVTYKGAERNVRQLVRTPIQTTRSMKEGFSDSVKEAASLQVRGLQPDLTTAGTGSQTIKAIADGKLMLEPGTAKTTQQRKALYRLGASLQSLLVAGGAVDVFDVGSKSEHIEALTQFQRAAQIPVTGIYDRPTVRKLLGQLKKGTLRGSSLEEVYLGPSAKTAYSVQTQMRKPLKKRRTVLSKIDAVIRSIDEVLGA